MIADTTGTQLTAHQICFKEYIKNRKCNGDSGHNGDRTYGTTDLLQGIHKISKVKDLIENPHILFRVTDTSDNTGKTSYSSVARKASVVLCDIPFISVIMRFYCII